MVTHACSASSSGGLGGKKCWLHLSDKEYETQSPATFAWLCNADIYRLWKTLNTAIFLCLICTQPAFCEFARVFYRKDHSQQDVCMNKALSYKPDGLSLLPASHGGGRELLPKSHSLNSTDTIT